jgi:Domain of unknown function (DUF4157)
MEHAVETRIQTDQKAGGVSRARQAAAALEPPNPVLQLQQQAGNLAVQEFLRAGVIRAKLAISNPDDPEEQEADEVADHVMRSHAGDSVAAPCTCSSGEEMCEECRQKQQMISRKGSANGDSPRSTHAVEQILRSPGMPLDRVTRSFFEPRFGQDFSDVRIHADTEAASSAHSINALAYAFGKHLVFGSGQFAPHSDRGRHLLAHELTHVAWQKPGIELQHGAIKRKYDDPYTYDPANESAWSYLGTKDVSKGIWQKPFLATLSAAPEAAMDTEKSLKMAEPPATDDDRDRVVAQIRQLIRLNAIGLMASNRSGVERKRDELLGQGQPPTAAPAGDKAAKDRALAANANAIRSAAAEAVRLNNLKEELEDSERQLRSESTSQLRVGGHSFSEAFQEMLNQTSKYRSAYVRQYFRALSQSLSGQRSLDRGTATALIFNMGRELADWRHKQIGGVIVALDQIYEAFPFLTQLAPADVPKAGEATDQELMEKVRSAFGDLLSKIDTAIIKIGAGDIDPFNLREAVTETRDSLSPAMKQVLDKAMEDFQVVQFWKDMGWTFAQVLLVFVPVVGPFLAAAVGAGQLLASVDELITRYQVAAASTTPEGEVLGVAGPSKFEWAMLGVQAALTAADLRGVWKEISASRAHFAEAEPKLIDEEGRLEPTGSVEGATKEIGAPTASQLDREAGALKEKIKEPENIRDVLDENLAKDYDFEISVEEGGEKHTYYHRRDEPGIWCRASESAFCGYSFGSEVEEALENVRQARRPSASGKPTEKFVEDFLGPKFKKQVGSFEGKGAKGRAKYGMSIADFASAKGRRITVEVKNIDIAANMQTGFADLRGQVGGYLSNVPHPDETKFWLFLDIRGQKLPPGGFKAIVESVSRGTGGVFDNVYLITEAGVVVY